MGTPASVIDPNNPIVPPDAPPGVQQMPNPIPQVGASPQPAVQQQPQAPQGAGTDPELQAAAVHHDRVANALQDALKAMSGGGQAMRLKKNTDGTVDVVPIDKTPGQMWGDIAKAALSGATKGFAAGQGPGGQARALAAGYDQGANQQQQQTDQTLANAQKINDQNRQKQLFNANMAMMDQKLIQATNDNQRSGAKFTDEMQKSSLDTLKNLDDMGAEELATWKTPDEMAQQYNTNPKIQQFHNGQGGHTLPVTTSDGVTHLYGIPEDMGNQFNKTPKSVDQWTLDSTGKPVNNPLTIGPGQMRQKDIAAAIKAAAIQQQNVMKASLDAQNAIKDTEIKKEEADTKKSVAPSEINKNNAEAGAAGSAVKGTLEMGENAQGQTVLYNNKTGAVTAAPGLQKVGTAAKQQAALEKDIGPGRDAMNFADSYLQGGKFTGPKDEALMEKYFDLAKPSTGFRMSKPQQDMLKNSQSFFDSMKASGRHQLTGTWFSDNQRKQIHDAMGELAAAKERGARQVYGMPTGGNPAPPAGVPKPPPTIGAIVEGHKYLGGDPANPASWQAQ
jgi:hypothetical protein